MFTTVPNIESSKILKCILRLKFYNITNIKVISLFKDKI